MPGIEANSRKNWLEEIESPFLQKFGTRALAVNLHYTRKALFKSIGDSIKTTWP